MGNVALTSSSIKEGRVRFTRRAVVVIALALLAYEAVRLYLQDVLHFALDYSEPNFGRLWPNRFWLLIHVAGASAALFCGPFQIWSGMHNRDYAVHRWTGRVYVGGVFVSGASAFYLSFFVQSRDFGVALFALATAWWLTVGMAFLAIKRQSIESHKRWMVRGYVVTFAFVTFRMWIDLPIWSSWGPARLAMVSWLSWVVPLLLTEVVLRWRDGRAPGHLGSTAMQHDARR